MKVEFLLAYEDHTWDTVIIDIPNTEINDEKDETLIAWANKNLLTQAQYREVVLISIYSILSSKENDNESN